MPAAGGGDCAGEVVEACVVAEEGDAGNGETVGDWVDDGPCESSVGPPDWMGSLISAIWLCARSTASKLAASADDCGSSDSAAKSILLGDGTVGDVALGGSEAARRVFIMATSNVKTDGPADGEATAAAVGDEDEAEEDDDDDIGEAETGAHAAAGGKVCLAGEVGNASEPN